MGKYGKILFTSEQHIELLKRRGLLINDEERAVKYLYTIGYYRLTGYMFHLKDKSSGNAFLPPALARMFRVVNPLLACESRA
ncbi:hypothetical protein [Kaistella sp.]|uniref:hypothetical protein n=1 Tax=Kaistella sp. TaxID=2782235 RepID=UPI002F940E36